MHRGEHSCRMTHAKFWKGKRECFGIIFQPERFGIISRLWSLLLLWEGLRCPSIWKGKSHHQPERFGFILRLWSLLLRRQGLARTCSVFPRVPFSFLSPLPLDCLRACSLSLPPFCKSPAHLCCRRLAMIVSCSCALAWSTTIDCGGLSAVLFVVIYSTQT